MISQAPQGIVMNPSDIWYVVLMIALFILVEFALARMPKRRREAGFRPREEKRQVRL